MFTGIIEATGTIRKIKSEAKQSHLWVSCSFNDVVLGESIAINGVCLTVANISEPGVFEFFVSLETLEKTSLKHLSQESLVNLERALKLETRLSGHLVQGHVDGVCQVSEVKPVENAHELWVTIPDELAAYCVEKGSLTLDGISLTINRISASMLSFMIIPHTWEFTNLKTRKVGDHLNVEVDVISKYVRKHVKELLNEHRKN